MRSVRTDYMDEEVRSLYESSFSEVEKIPTVNIARALDGGAFLDRYSEDEEFIGFTMGFVYRDMVFLVYFATRPEVRGNGYGSEILDMLRDEFSTYRMFLVTEPLDPEAEDNYMRVRRQAFYRRNGCRDTGVKVVSDGEWFDTMFVQGTLTEDEMVSVIRNYEDVHNGRARLMRCRRTVSSTA